MLFLLPGMPSPPRFTKFLLLLDPAQGEAFPNPRTQPTRCSLETENLSSDRGTAEGLVCTRWTQSPGKTVRPHGAAKHLFIELGPGASLTPEPQVSFLCLLECPPAAPTPKC